MSKIEVITHFAKDDKDCSCDYYSVDVKIGGKFVRHYSDHYHDKGAVKAEAFVDGFMHANGDDSNLDEDAKNVLRTEKADDKT